MKKLELTAEQLAKVQQAKAKAQRTSVDSEWLAISEFGKHYGWLAVEAVLQNKITSEQMLMLLEGARKIQDLELYNISKAVFIGTASSKSKKPTMTFRKLTKDLVKGAKPNNE